MGQYIRDGRAPIPKKASTSKLMHANKAKDTGPEILFRKALWKAGFRGYRLHPRELPGRPDISFGKVRLAVFINGCFWHRCPTCNLPLPQSNIDFWKNKFDTNVLRDQKKIRALEEIGWRTITIWECKITSDLEDCLEQVGRELEKEMLKHGPWPV
jgi:DNA mismatch endonuclease (patch repair protein)